MKYNIYNNTVKLANGFELLYNAMSDRFLVIKGNAVGNIVSHSANDLKSANRKLYDDIKSIGGIVDDDRNEVDDLDKMIKSIDNNDSNFILHINPTLDCNFRCWYCYENHVKGSKMSSGMVENTKKLIRNIICSQKNLKTMQVSFFGGEPLLHFNSVAREIMLFAKLEAESHAVKLCFHFTTNAFMLNEKMFSFFKDFDVSFQITIDGDCEQHDKTRFCHNGTGSYHTIVKNIKALARQRHSVIARINYTASNISGVWKVIEDIGSCEEEAKQHIRIDLQQVWQDAKNNADTIGPYLLSITNQAREAGLAITSCKTFDRVRNGCYGDKRNHAVINYNGDVFNCTARDFIHENRSGYVSDNGSIVYENDALNRRMKAKFSKPVCHKCTIAPICGGGCAQKAIENINYNGCIYGMDKERIEKVILDRFEYKFIPQQAQRA